MSKEIFISSTPHETRLAIVENDALTEIYYERENEYTLAGSIYNGKVTRVLPGMQSSFVDIGLERDAFLYITDFMEEAGETADFEASAGEPSRSETRQGARPQGENRRDRGPRPERDPQPRPAAEPSDADLFKEAVAGLEPGRPAGETERRPEGDRNRRGGRSRGRGHDRPRGSESASSQPQQVANEGVSFAAPADAAAPHEEENSILTHPSPVEAEEVGEGAPGADGSRRWRGRRGRRGNRGNAVEQPVTPIKDAVEPISSRPEATPRAATGPMYDAYGTTEKSPETTGLKTTIASSGDTSAEIKTSFDTTQTRGEGRGPERGGRDRGGRDRGGRERGGRERGGREPGGQERGADRGGDRSTRVARGFTPSANLYKVEGANESPEEDRNELAPVYGQAEERAVPLEPVILPGESLGKYRVGGEAAAPQANVPAAAPAVPEFVASGWDGGAVLPGETIRPRGPVAGGQEARSPREDRGGRDERGRGRNDRGRGGRGERQERGPRPERFETRGPAAQAMPEMALDDRAAAQASPTASAFETPLNSTFVPPPPMPTPVQETVATVPELSQEYEPEAASASFRVDVAPVREFRQAAPLSEMKTPEASGPEQVAAIVPETAPIVPESVAIVPETAAFAESGELAAMPEVGSETAARMNSASMPAETDPADLHTVSPELKHAFEHAAQQTPEAPEVTSISATGEMHTETMEASLEELPQIEESEPAFPGHSSSSNQSHEGAAEEGVAGYGAGGHAMPGFAPGAGVLEEEMLDDDGLDDVLDEEEFASERSLPMLRASAFAEQEAHFEAGERRDGEMRGEMPANELRGGEQETLEAEADLGTMLREMSIEERTRGVQALEEEDDEEDFFEEDQDFPSALRADEELEGEESFAEEGEGLDEVEHSAYGSGFEGEHAPAAPEGEQAREPRREGRREGRRDGRRGERNRRPGGGERFATPPERGAGERPAGEQGSAERSSQERASSERGRSSGGGDRGRNGSGHSAGHRSGHGSGHGSGHSMQTTNLPAISDLLKPGQELLCQIAKEPIAKKGARITSHIALPGRFLVFMPTVSHTGVSRKIESDGERRRLKEILLSEKGEAAGGFIVRTAAAGASEQELRSDLRFLLNLWADIKARSESSKAPALIYHDLNLVERVLRDQVTDNFSAIWVDTEAQYEQVLRFLQRFQPTLLRRVKLYTKETPLFEQFGITEEINKGLRSKVWLKSGGSIVINQTEALVAIDINTGKFVGKTARLEDTIVKTNLDAIPEIVRQIRLRDLGGIIIIDFIDMDERKNRNRVLAAMEEELKSDRAPSKVLPFNDFGLIAITRKRVKQSLERTLSTTCGVCAGTGMTKSPVTVCNDIYIEMRKMQKHLDRGDVMLRVHPEVVKQLKAPATHWLQEMEEMVGKTILVKSDPSLHPEQFDIH